MDVNEFTERIINGDTGFKVWEDREWVVFKDREKGIADFVIRCLANPHCEGSQEVLDAINERRKELTK
ncbi:hypothetical protein [Spirosoma foliorum]|uniref:Uncharacterized protein n=1 Tax=Spirosoma foliorum TaxID=2710596 RepID=A0A7G5H2M3_9BACT|nr:hypothetical protein [Spirosoma foliorum]QMW05365.1 hypothetical protein H3H32_10970 [Spirosoma foliorum]